MYVIPYPPMVVCCIYQVIVMPSFVVILNGVVVVVVVCLSTLQWFIDFMSIMEGARLRLKLLEQ